MASAALQPPRAVAGTSARRPKLSLQTAVQAQLVAPKGSISAAPSYLADSPTSRNTNVNAARTGLGLNRGSPTSPRRSISATTSPRTSSPLNTAVSLPGTIRTTPYALPHNSRPILRNSPLKDRLSLSASARSPRRAFASKKQVLFRDSLVELMPTPIIDSSDSENEEQASTPVFKGNMGEHGETRMPHQPTPISKHKKQREWVWTIGNDSPAESKIIRGKDHKPIYPRTPLPGDGESSAGSDDDRAPSQIPVPTTPATPLIRTPKTPSRIPLPDTPIKQVASKNE